MTIILGFLLVLIGLGWFLAAGLVLGHRKPALTARPDPKKFAILIPARNESNVIEHLLKSLAAQNIMSHPSKMFTMRDVYVIVESETDPTVKICRRYGASVILRSHPERQRKGYALDEAIKQILAQHPAQTRPFYDLYFIFDADNTLGPDYFDKMLSSYRQGYELATGYRHPQNANANVIAAVSSLTFAMINTVGNVKRTTRGGNLIFSGTGFYVDGRLVEQWHGWPFHSLTEDYELSLYAILHGFTTFYNTQAVFYDEQPTSYLQTIAQRTRWIKGYFSARAKYIPLMRRALKRKHGAKNAGSLRREVIGVKPIILTLVGVVLLFLGGLIELCMNGEVALAFLSALATFAAVYFVLMFITIELIKREKLRLTPEICLKTILFNPIYLLTYVYCALKALLVKNVKWTRIEHSGE